MMKPLECGHVYPNGTGRRKRCPDCDRIYRLQYAVKYNKENYYYEKKRPNS